MSEVRYPEEPIEGICWDGRDLVLVAEGGAIFRIVEKTWRARTPIAKSARKAGCGNLALQVWQVTRAD